MADIFISYSQSQRDLTTQLAADLQLRGYTVWWDTALLPTDGPFPEAIKREIDAARAVIVIWTAASVTSQWVYAEAARAWDQDKLIPVRVRSLKPKDIPLPFGTISTDFIDEREKVYAAVASIATRIGTDSKESASIVANPRPQSIYMGKTEEAIWHFVKDTKHPQDLYEFLENFPDGFGSKFARRRLLEMEENWWQNLDTDNTWEVSRFLQAFPGGEYEGAARELIRGHKFKEGCATVAGSVTLLVLLLVAGYLIYEWRRDDSIRTFPDHDEYIYSVVFSQDGRNVLSGGSGRTMKLWDVSTGQKVRTFSAESSRSPQISAVAISRDGRFILSGNDDNTARLWEMTTGKEIRILSNESGWFGWFRGVNSVSFSPDGSIGLSGGDDKTVKLWELASGQKIRDFVGHSATVNSVAYSPNGHYVVSGSGDKTIKLWDSATGQLVHTYSGHTDKINSVAFSPDGSFLLSGGDDMTLKLWSVATGAEIRNFSLDGVVHAVAFSPNGHIAAANATSRIHLLNVDTGKAVAILVGHWDSVSSLAFSSDGTRLVSGSLDKTVKLWDISKF